MSAKTIGRSLLLGVVLVCTSSRALVAAEPTPAPTLELWTMGQGEDVFERYGHAALCVFDAPDEDGRCYNYGITDFRNPGDLVLRFLRNQAIFWVAPTSADRMMEVYQALDRTIWIQRLPLTESQARELADRLEHDARPENRNYSYDHFYDNCTTRLRDHLDAVLGGQLHAGQDRVYGPTWREMVRAGISADPPLVALADVLPGRWLEKRPSRWEAMFHPDVLRLVVWERLGVEPELVVRRQGRPLATDPNAGRRLLVWIGIALAAVAGFLVASRRRVAVRLGLVLVALVLVPLALVVDVTELFFQLHYLHGNEVALVLLPSDFLLPLLGGRTLRIYLDLRLGLLALCTILVWLGVLVQPLGSVIVLAGLPLACVRAALVDDLPWQLPAAIPWPWARRRGARPAPTSARP